MKTKWSIQKLIHIGMLAAIAGVLMPLEFLAPMTPSLYKINFSDAPSIIALSPMGPASAVRMEVIKIIIRLTTVGTSSMYVEEFANLTGIALFAIPMWTVYKKGGRVCWVVTVSLAANVPIRTPFACFCNVFITPPLYAAAMGLPPNQVITMVAAANPAISDLTIFIFPATIPFNLIRLGLNYFAGHLLYTRPLAVYPVVRTT